jgi:hypothetical protein
LLRDAAKKTTNRPLLIFLDVNHAPVQSRRIEDRLWLDPLSDALDATERKYGRQYGIVVTNFAYHYGDPSGPLPLSEFCFSPSKNADRPLSPLAIQRIVDALSRGRGVPGDV